MTSKAGGAGVKLITENGWAKCRRGGMDCSDKELLRRRPTDDEVTLYNSRSQYGDWLLSIRENTDPICPVEVGHRSNSVCVLHHLSMKLGGRTLQWDPAKETIVGDAEASALMTVPMRAPWKV